MEKKEKKKLYAFEIIHTLHFHFVLLRKTGKKKWAGREGGREIKRDLMRENY